VEEKNNIKKLARPKRRLEKEKEKEKVAKKKKKK